MKDLLKESKRIGKHCQRHYHIPPRSDAGTALASAVRSETFFANVTVVKSKGKTVSRPKHPTWKGLDR